MFHKVIILSLGIFALTGCDAQKKSRINTKASEMQTNPKAMNSNDQKDGVLYLSEGENKFLREYQMNVTFKGVSEDSRCPEGANCIWAGVALAQVEVMGTSTRPMTLNLASADYPGKDYHQSAEFNGYILTLQDVAPTPKSQDGAKALTGKYKIGITIKKADQSTNSTKK
ncbi:hypothetical protein [Chryseobacterium sp.]|jgi:hypothetical protein|uniref:hypothetical protein n=1 Tax=Chryseobacterium sp. TaxID=1871047 RepID=UPI00284E2224|nr:hypothetical protein [Chryseobacterium sp.]MDR3022427.1 hypothetical protein [Chryseobacterium sp.]